MSIATDYMKPNETARLLSPVFTPSANGCSMRFFYHMFGRDGVPPSTLSIKLKTSSAAESIMQTLWTMNSNQGDMWTKVVVHIPATKNYQIVIEAKRTYSHHSSVSIDDVSFSKDCQPSLIATLDPRPVTPSPPPGCQSGEFR